MGRAVEVARGERREAAEEIGVKGCVNAPVREPVRDEQVMDLVSERQCGRLVPRRERGIRRERGREHKRERPIGLDAREHGRCDAHSERKHEENTHVFAVEPSEREREDQDEQRSPRDRIEGEKAARPRGDEAGRDSERAGRGAERGDREAEDLGRDRIGRGFIHPDLRERAPQQNGRDRGADGVRHPCHAGQAAALRTRGGRGTRARGGRRVGRRR